MRALRFLPLCVLPASASLAAPMRAAHLTPRAVACADSLARRLEQDVTPWLEEQAKREAFSGVVLVACEGRPVYVAAHGLADRDRGRRVTPETRFNLGSMNKLWTSVAVAQLVEQGKIRLDDPVGRYLPELPSQAVRERVTIAHLLTPRSGLGSYFRRGFLRDRVLVSRMSDYLPFFIEDSLSFEPGTRMQYSNAGFALLGMIVERVSGTSYYEYVQRHILRPAGMQGAEFVDLRTPPADIAVAYARRPGELAASASWDQLEQRGGPAGGAYARASDIVAFSRALFGGKLLRASTLDEFLTPRFALGATMQQAYGFAVSDAGGIRTAGHNGGAPGVGTDFRALRDRQIDVVVLTNVDMPMATEAMGRVMRALGGQPSASASAQPSSPRPAGATASSPDGTLPDTHAGRRLSAWLAAFATTDERYAAFIAKHMVPRSDVSPAARAAAAREFAGRVGRLTFVRVVRDAGTEFVVEARGEGGASWHVVAELEPREPFRLVTVRIVPAS